MFQKIFKKFPKIFKKYSKNIQKIFRKISNNLRKLSKSFLRKLRKMHYFIIFLSEFKKLCVNFFAHLEEQDMCRIF